jgi:hypothetical protein
VFKHGLEQNHISAPRVCQYEGVDIASIAQKYVNVYQDITNVFNQADLPRLFAGESQQEMHSYQLGNFAEAADSLVYVPTETVYFGRRTHITEKTFKAIALEMPFVLVAPAGSLAYLREYGFKTFTDIFDESYDTLDFFDARLNILYNNIKYFSKEKYLDPLTEQKIKHNYNRFYDRSAVLAGVNTDLIDPVLEWIHAT